MSAWPSVLDYQAAIQNPSIAFVDERLRRANIVTNAMGLPVASTGNFAVVYKARLDAREWAIRCFTRDVGDLQCRYMKIISHFLRIPSMRRRFLVSFSYHPNALLIGGSLFPVLKMRWVSGVTLSRFVEQNLREPDRLLFVAEELSSIVSELSDQGIVHGDISAENLLIGEDPMRLIDYDGVSVPALAGYPQRESGNPCFQHPRRVYSDMTSSLDYFSALVLITALSALAVDPRLYSEFGRGEGLLFAPSDFQAPESSELFSLLCRCNSPGVQQLSSWLLNACRSPAEALDRPPTLPFRTALRPVSILPNATRSTTRSDAPWWVEHQRYAGNELRNAAPGSTAATSAVPAGSQLGGRPMITPPVTTFINPCVPPATTVSPVSPASSPAPSPPAGAISRGTFPLVANASTGKFHHTWCEWARKISRGNRVTISGRAEALRLSLVPCRSCRP